ncbi:FBD-associated F-box protein [Rosa sericea]
MAYNSKLQQREKTMLSELPDEVLGHILSFFGTKCAVRTSILSKKWRNMWASVPNLYFNDENTNDELGFKTFVNRILSLHNLPNINKFHLRCCVDDFSHIERWICIALRRNVVEVDLSILSEGEEIFELPSRLFTSKTLKALTLGSNFIIHSPIAFCFPSLKFLSVHIYHPDIESMMSLFSRFPVLEDLTLDGTIGDEELKLDIIAPKLKTLTISLCTEREAESDSESEDEGGEDDGGEDENEDHNIIGGCGFYIKAPKLEIINLSVDVLSDYELKYEKLLVTANIDLYDHSASEHPTFANHASALLESVSDVKYLSLSAHCLEASCLPYFNKLKELKLVFQNCHQLESLLLDILDRSLNLECLVLDREVESCACTTQQCSENPLETLEAVPLCLTSKLKIISIIRFTGHPEEMEVMKYLLKNSLALKTTTIFAVTNNCGDAKQVQRNLCMFPRGSETCEVEFIS